MRFGFSSVQPFDALVQLVVSEFQIAVHGKRERGEQQHPTEPVAERGGIFFIEKRIGKEHDFVLV